MLRVLHVSEFIKGGVATYLNTLIRHQLEDTRISEVRILVSHQHRQYLPDLPDEVIIPFDYPRRSLSGLNQLRTALGSSLRTFQPSLIQLTSTFPGVIGRSSLWYQTRRSASTPAVVYCAQGWSFLMDCGSLRRFAYRHVERILSRQTDRIICISKNELEAAASAGISRDRCDLVYNALPVTPPVAEPIVVPEIVKAARRRGDRVFLFVGRYDRQKGLDLLHPAFDGPSDKGDVLMTAGGQAVNPEKVRFGSRMVDMGWATPGQVVSLLEASDALIVPSRWEGFGLVAAEAMRAERAVICSNRGGLPEVVTDDVTGIVLPSLDSESISRAIAGVSNARLKSFGTAGAEKFQRLFASDKMHGQTMDVYLSAMKIAGRRCRNAQ